METVPHILVVDDDREIRDLLARFLERHQFRVTTARDTREARRALPAGHYQLLILDLMLPNRSGTETLQDLRAADDADLAATPVLMLTARGQTGDDGARADAVLAKPFDNQELRATVRRMLA